MDTTPEISLVRRSPTPSSFAPSSLISDRGKFAKRVFSLLTATIGISLATGCGTVEIKPPEAQGEKIPADATEAKHAGALPYKEFQKRLATRWKEPYYMYGCLSDRKYHWALPQHPPDKSCYVKAICEHPFKIGEASKEEKHKANCLALPDPDFIYKSTTGN